MYNKYELKIGEPGNDGVIDSAWVQMIEQTNNRNKYWCVNVVDALIGVVHYNCHTKF